MSGRCGEIEGERNCAVLGNMKVELRLTGEEAVFLGDGLGLLRCWDEGGEAELTREEVRETLETEEEKGTAQFWGI